MLIGRCTARRAKTMNPTESNKTRYDDIMSGLSASDLLIQDMDPVLPALEKLNPIEREVETRFLNSAIPVTHRPSACQAVRFIFIYTVGATASRMTKSDIVSSSSSLVNRSL